MKNQITKHHEIFNGCMQLMEIEWQKEVGILELKHGGEMIEKSNRLTRRTNDFKKNQITPPTMIRQNR